MPRQGRHRRCGHTAGNGRINSVGAAWWRASGRRVAVFRIRRQYIRASAHLRRRRTVSSIAHAVQVAVSALVLAGSLVLSGIASAQSATPPPLVPTTTETQDIEKLVRERQYDDALKRLDALLARTPRNVQARFLRAVVLADTGRTAEAVAAFEAMTQEFPELPEPYNNLAVIHAAAGRYDVARALLLRAIDVAPNYVTAQENLGDLHLAMAADVYARALKLDPNNAALKAKLQLAREAGAKLRASR
jgi:Flp pilus assembly protein TadD